MNYKALLQRRADLLNEARALLDKPELSAEDRARDDAIQAELQTVAGDLARFERLHEAERTAPVPAGSAARVTLNVEQDPMRGFADAADFARSVRAACAPRGLAQVDPRLLVLGPASGIGGPAIQAAPSGYMQEGHAADGYAVPPQVSTEIMALVFAEDDLLALSQPEPTESNAVAWLADESTPWGATGIQAAWRAEAGQMTPSKLATADRQLRLHELYAFVLATDELLDDAPRLNARLTTGAARAITWKASEAIMRGTGAGQPLGWETAPCLVTINKETGQAAATIVPANLTKMRARFWRGPGARPMWIASDEIIPQLYDLRLGNEPSWIARDRGLTGAPEGLLLGFPIRFSEHCKALGTAGDIQLVNLAGYYATMKRGGVRFDSSIHLYFDYGTTAFRWTFRLGGQPYISAPISPANGTATKSPFVYLQTRI